MHFERSDTVAGYVRTFDPGLGQLVLKTHAGDVTARLTGNVFARFVRNLGEPYADCTGQLPTLLIPGRWLFAYGIFYPDGASDVFEIKSIDLLGSEEDTYRFEEATWWAEQARQIADFYVGAQFGKEAQAGDGAKIDYRNYRTILQLNGEKKSTFRQETDTISRLIYGMASAYMLTGIDVYREAARKGCAYLREHMRFLDTDDNVAFWYHGIDVTPTEERKVFASEFGDDYDAVPMYEQIYALAGFAQTYRITGDPLILEDIERTMALFARFFKDDALGGYFSHADPITLNPRADSLGKNRARKNWNSVGDHAPAYLINLYLATGDPAYRDMLEHTADCIVEHFEDYQNSPFVEERFFEDWSPDHTWGWQQDNGVVGHNLKIAWNLMRIHSLIPKDAYVALALKIAEIMPHVGMDRQRGGWYDVMARTLTANETVHRFTWHDRKAWWQQEQGILAYQILYGVLKNPDHLALARESAAFYNAFFLDNDDGAVYFNVLANGIPYLMGNERLKGSHSMSAYHSIELCYLASVYTNLLNTKQPLVLHFCPGQDAFPDDILRVSPDLLPKGAVRIAEVTLDGIPYPHFDPRALTVCLPKERSGDVHVMVRLEADKSDAAR